MAITSSTALFDGPVQADGRQQVRETHLLSDDSIVTVAYYAAPSDDIKAIAEARAPSIAEALAAAEAFSIVERDGPFTLNHQTGAQFAVRFREMVAAADKERAGYLAWWLSRRIAQGHTTDAAVRSAFGMTAAQWTTFKSAKVTPRANAWAAVIAATGE